MKIAFILMFFLLVAGWDVPDLWMKKRKKDMAVYSALMAAGLILSILTAYHVKLPNPSKGLEAVFKPFTAILKQ